MDRPIPAILFLTFLASAAGHCAEPPAAPSGLRRFMVTPVVVTRKVRRDELLPEVSGSRHPQNPRTVRIALARNEFESAQIVVRSTQGDLRNLRICPGRMRRASDGAAFPAAGVALFRVGFVQTYNLWNTKQSLGWLPDPLIPLNPGEPMQVPAGWNQPVLIRFHAAPDTPSGEYRGRITVTADGFAPETLPVRLTVFDFTLPQEQHFTASIPIWGGQPEKMYPGSMTSERRRAFLDFLLAHRISPFPLDPDETAYAMSRGMRWFCVLTLPKDHVPRNLAKRAARIRDRWRERGWFDRGVPYVLLGDEPNVAQWQNILEQGRILHRIEPRLVRMNTVSLDALFAGPDRPRNPTEGYIRTFDTLGKAVDWFILAAGCYPVGKGTELARARGCNVWWYSVADIVYIPTPGAHVRIHFWKQWKYRVPGWLHWGMTYWGETNIRGTNGRKWPDAPWDTRASRSGDGYLVYPAPGSGRFWPSLRLETIRDGIEDYEYFVLLDSLTERLKRIQSEEAAGRAADNARLLATGNGLVRSYREAVEDGAALLDARRRLARAIEATRKLTAR